MSHIMSHILSSSAINSDGEIIKQFKMLDSTKNKSIHSEYEPVQYINTYNLEDLKSDCVNSNNTDRLYSYIYAYNNLLRPPFIPIVDVDTTCSEFVKQTFIQKFISYVIKLKNLIIDITKKYRRYISK